MMSDLIRIVEVVLQEGNLDEDLATCKTGGLGKISEDKVSSC